MKGYKPISIETDCMSKPFLFEIAEDTEVDAVNKLKTYLDDLNLWDKCGSDYYVVNRRRIDGVMSDLGIKHLHFTDTQEAPVLAIDISR